MRSAKKINSENWLVLNNLCEYYMIVKRYDEALVEIKKAIQIAPELPNPFDTMGDLQFEIGDNEKAIEYYIQAIEIDSTYANGYLHLARVYEKEGNKEYIELYKKASQLNNKEASIWLKINKKIVNEHSGKSKNIDYIEELKKLAELRDLGIITDEEFQEKKKKLLGL